VLLCAAAEAGDYGEVVRLLSSMDVSPNARGLRHKNALHLAAAKGHAPVVQCLLLNKVRVWVCQVMNLASVVVTTCLSVCQHSLDVSVCPIYLSPYRRCKRGGVQMLDRSCYTYMLANLSWKKWSSCFEGLPCGLYHNAAISYNEVCIG